MELDMDMNIYVKWEIVYFKKLTNIKTSQNPEK